MKREMTMAKTSNLGLAVGGAALGSLQLVVEVLLGRLQRGGMFGLVCPLGVGTADG